MARTGIGYRDVANAAEKLQGQERNPTVDNIRELLGTGSKSTILRYLNDWKAQSSDVWATGVPQELAALVKGLWEQLQTKAEQKITQHQEEAQIEVKTSEEKHKAALKESKALQTQVQQLEQKLFQEQEGAKVLTQELSKERLEVSKNIERVRSLEEQVASQQKEHAKLHILLKNMQNNLEHYQTAMQKLQQEQALAVERQQNQFEQELSYLRNQLSDSVNEKNHFALQVEKLHHQLEGLEQYKTQNQTLEQKSKEYQIRTITLEESSKILRSQHADLLKTVEKKQQALVVSEQRVAVVISQCGDLKQALQQAEDKISTLRHEQLFIAQEKAHLEGQLKELIKKDFNHDIMTECKKETQGI